MRPTGNHSVLDVTTLLDLDNLSLHQLVLTRVPCLGLLPKERSLKVAHHEMWLSVPDFALIFLGPIPKEEGQPLWPLKPGGISTPVYGVQSGFNCGLPIRGCSHGLPLCLMGPLSCLRLAIDGLLYSALPLHVILHKPDLILWREGHIGYLPLQVAPHHLVPPVPQGKNPEAEQCLSPASWRLLVQQPTGMRILASRRALVQHAATNLRASKCRARQVASL
jgi:hypothetical protein